MVKISAEYLGDLKVALEHEPSGAKITTAAPKDNQGDGSSFSPTDLLASSLLACMLTLMGIMAKKSAIDFRHARGEIEKITSTDSPRRVAKLLVRISVSTKLSDQEQLKLINAAKTCPVKHSLAPEIEVDVQFNWINPARMIFAKNHSQ